MITSELYNLVDGYVQKNITVEELEDWIAARFQLFFSSSPSAVSEFVAGIELGLAELSNGSRTEEEFRSMVSDLLRQVDAISITYPEERTTTVSASSNRDTLLHPYAPDSEFALVFTS